MSDIVVFCRERAESYGALRGSSLTAIALDRAAEEIERLRALMDASTNKDETIAKLREAMREAVAALEDDASIYQRKRKAGRILTAALTSTKKEG